MLVASYTFASDRNNCSSSVVAMLVGFHQLPSHELGILSGEGGGLVYVSNHDTILQKPSFGLSNAQGFLKKVTAGTSAGVQVTKYSRRVAHSWCG